MRNAPIRPVTRVQLFGILVAALAAGSVAGEADDLIDDAPILPESSENVEELLDEREKNDSVSPADKDYPGLSGCDPLEGDREALPLMDRLHRAISEALCDPAEQLDDTLADDSEEDGQPEEEPEPQDVAGSPDTGTALVRVATELELRKGHSPQPGLSLSASLRLPQAYQRITLLMQRQSEALTDDDAFDDDESSVIWVARPALFVLNHTDIGVRGYAPFIRVRLPTTHTFDNGLSWRVRPETYWRWDDGAGVGTELRFTFPEESSRQWALDQRIETNESLHKDDMGWAWSQQLTYTHQIQERFTLTFRTQTDGYTEPDWQAESIRTDVRLRRSIWRPWFYAEAEPFTEWTRDNQFDPSPGFILRLEIQFGDYD